MFKLLCGFSFFIGPRLIHILCSCSYLCFCLRLNISFLDEVLSLIPQEGLGVTGFPKFLHAENCFIKNLSTWRTVCLDIKSLFTFFLLNFLKTLLHFILLCILLLRSMMCTMTFLPLCIIWPFCWRFRELSFLLECTCFTRLCLRVD